MLTPWGKIRTLLAHLADHRDLPTIVAGDLNALPQSALLRFLTTGALDLATVPDRTHVSGQARGGGRPPSGRWDPEHLALATGDAEETVLRHALDLRCAYGAVFGHQLVQHLPPRRCGHRGPHLFKPLDQAPAMLGADATGRPTGAEVRAARHRVALGPLRAGD